MSGMQYRLDVFGTECGAGETITVGFDAELKRSERDAPILLQFSVQERGIITVHALRTVPGLRVFSAEFARIRDIHNEKIELAEGTSVDLKELPREGRSSCITIGDRGPKLTWTRKTEDLLLISKVIFSRSIT